jgi:hypothetical protein
MWAVEGEGGKERARRGLGQNGPSQGGEGFFSFLFSIPFFPFSILVSFYSLFLLNQ